MEKSILFLVLLGIFSGLATTSDFLERKPGSSLLVRRSWGGSSPRYDRYAADLAPGEAPQDNQLSQENSQDMNEPQEASESHDDSHGAAAGEKSGHEGSHDSHEESHDDHYDVAPTPVSTKKRHHRSHAAEETESPQDQFVEDAGENLDSALEGDPNAKPWDVPKPPTDLNQVSNSLNTVTDQFQKIPGAGIVTNKDGLFGDVFTGDENGSGVDGGEEDDYSHSEYITSTDSDELPPNVDELLTIDLGDTGSLDKSYISIADDLKHYENTYLDCLDKLSDLDFNQKNINGCIGTDGRYVIDDIEFFKRKILARADSIIRARLVENCFKEAGVDLAESAGCDLLQKDALQLLWAELNYHDLIDYHRNKYLVQAAVLPVELLDTILAEFKSLYAKQTDLLVELYNHKTLTVQRVRDYVADRMGFLEDLAEENGPLQHATLSLNKIIKVDSASKKLKELSSLRASMPLGVLDRARKARELSKHVPQFSSPWTNSGHRSYGRGPVAEGLKKSPQPQATIQLQINAVL